MNHLSRNILEVIVATAALAAPALAQPATTVTLSAPISCKGATPAFTTLMLSTNISMPTDSSTGLPSGRLNFADVTLTKNVDDCSVALYSALFAFTRIPSVTISFYNSINAANREVMRITLSNVLVTSISDAGTANSAPSEKITLDYQQIEILDPITGADKIYVR